jgi:WD40 repeat protein
VAATDRNDGAGGGEGGAGDDDGGSSSTSSGGSGGDDGGLLRRVHILCGHEAPVTALALSTALDLVVSGAANGHVLLHRLQAGDHVRHLVGGEAGGVDAARFGAVSLLAVSAPLGCVVVHCRQTLSLRVFSVNGDLLSEAATTQALYAMAVTQAGDLLVVGGDRGLLEFYSIHDLVLLRSKPFQSLAPVGAAKKAAASKGVASSKGSEADDEEGANSPITCLTFGKDFQYLFIGTANGEVWICTDPKIRLEMLDIAINKTFAGMI